MAQHVQSQVNAAPQPAPKSEQSFLLQRKCDCGGPAGLSGDCQECDREKLLQRRAVGDAPAGVPPIVHDVLRSPGQPLDVGTRSFMEQRFGHNFGSVQAHSVVPQRATTGLTVGAAGDQFEQEADHVAQRVAQPPGHGSKDKSASRAGYDFSSVRVHTDQRAAQSARAGESLVVASPGQNPVPRPAKKGDSHQDADKTKAKLDSLPKVDPKEWVCPLQRSAEGQIESAEAPPIIHDVLRSPGQPLDAATRALMAPHFAYDFSRLASNPQSKLTMSTPGDRYEVEAEHLAEQVVRSAEPESRFKSSASQAESLRLRHRETSAVDFSRVRVHADAQAAEAARSINARAFTLGHDIFFGPDQYAPQTTGGRRLLAHELTHVGQQRATHSSMVARQGLEQYETTPTKFTGKDIETAAAKGSYWEQKIAAVLEVTYISPVATRFSADAEERDAVMSTLWKARPPTLSAKTVLLVNIPARAGAKASQTLVYEFTFTPKDPTKDKLDKVAVAMRATGAAAAVLTPKAPPAGFSPTPVALKHGGFPGNDIKDYWLKHPEEQKQVFNWIENVALDPFEQIITTEVAPPAGSKTPPQKATFQVSGKKSGGNIQDLLIRFLGAMATTKTDPPAGYHDKDRLDLNIEKLQTQPHDKKKDKLGAIKNLDKLPADEKIPVKYVIWQYFDNGTRNAEVDVIVPIMTTGKRVFYTLRFKSNNDVEIERVAEEETDKSKPPGKGKKSLTEIDVARVRGYTDNAKDPTALKTWLKKRYPSVTPQGATVEDLRQSVNTTIQSDAGKPDWFKTNYDLHVLPKKDGQTRLKTTHGLPDALTGDVKDFSSSDLNIVEFALQTMSELILALIKGVRLIRKVLGFSRDNSTKPYKSDPALAGKTQEKGSDKSITIFDKAFQGDALLFLGGMAGVRPESTMTAAHEFGHIIEAQAGILKAFSDFVAKNKIKPITWYAAKQPAEDFFTEAFALYNTDPEWMKNNQLKLYNWFEELNKKGTPPAP